MLAQNFLSHAVLGITDVQHADLVRTLGRMERMETPADRFDMRTCGAPDSGTGCILGWARGRYGNIAWPSAHEILDRADSLSRLFFPHHVPGAYGANVEQGAFALRSYLSTGEANWAGALA